MGRKRGRNMGRKTSLPSLSPFCFLCCFTFCFWFFLALVPRVYRLGVCITVHGAVLKRCSRMFPSRYPLYDKRAPSTSTKYMQKSCHHQVFTMLQKSKRGRKAVVNAGQLLLDKKKKKKTWAYYLFQNGTEAWPSLHMKGIEWFWCHLLETGDLL